MALPSFYQIKHRHNIYFRMLRKRPLRKQPNIYYGGGYGKYVLYIRKMNAANYQKKFPNIDFRSRGRKAVVYKKSKPI